MAIHRGTVINNVDPMGLGRLQVVVPGISSEPLAWALPVLQLGPAVIPALTPIGAGVWVTFENDDFDFPVVLGQWATFPPMMRE